MRGPPSELMAVFFRSEGEVFREYWDAECGEDIAHESGFLMLTNHRLVFVKKFGLFPPTYVHGFDIPLETIPGMQVRERLLRPPQLFVRGTTGFVLGSPPHSADKLRSIRSKIAAARVARIEALSVSLGGGGTGKTKPRRNE